MYESPITAMITNVTDNIAKQFAEQTENMVYQEVRNVGVYVDKEELVKALAYDRNQYQKGYDDAMSDAVPREKINRMIEEITKYAQAMDWISGYDVLLLIHKYCDEVKQD